MKDSKYEGKGRKETLYFFFYNFVSKAITYLVLFVLANIFSLEVYGKAAYAISIFSISLLALLIGVPETLISWQVRKKDSTSVVYFLSFLSLIFVLFGITAFWNHKWVFPLIFVLPFFLFKGIGYAFFRIHHKHHFVQIFGVASMLLYLGFLLVFRNMGEFGIVLSYSLAYFCVAMMVVSLTRGDYAKVLNRFKMDFRAIKEYFKKGIVTAFISISFAFLTWIDSSILGLLSTYENVAKYNVAGSISAVMLVVPVAISMFLLTRSAEIKNDKTSLSLLKRSLRISVSITLFLGIIIVSLIEPILRIFFAQYVGIESYVVLLIFGLMFAAVNHVVAMYYSGKLKPEAIFYPIFFAALLNVILDVVLIPGYGMYGIIFATVISHFFAMVVLTFKSGLGSYFFPIILASLFIFLAYYFGIFGILSLVVLIPLLYALGLFTLEDFNVIKNVIKNLGK